MGIQTRSCGRLKRRPSFARPQKSSRMGLIGPFIDFEFTFFLKKKEISE
jgi:hypothetical protein